MNIQLNIFRDLKVEWYGNEYNNETFDDSIIFTYHEIKDVDLYLNNSIEGNILKNKIENNLIECIFIPTDFYPINEKEKYFYKKNKKILKHKNVKFYATDKLDDEFSEMVWGISILKPFFNLLNSNTSFSGLTHFLTLNGHKKSHRIFLKKFLEENDFLKHSIYSFGWEGVSPDLKISKENIYDHSNIEVIRDSRQTQYDINILDKFYKECLFEIVCPSGKYLVTEKSLKPILYGTPFIIWFKENKMDTGFVNNLLFITNWYKNIGIDINYFNIDYRYINSVEDKIKELVSMSIADIQEKYKDTFDKAKQNKEIIKLHLKKYYNIINTNHIL